MDKHQGVVHVLAHANTHRHPHIVCRVDSLIIARQLQGVWACRSSLLSPYYTRALNLLTTLQRASDVISIRVEHVYREYNSDADGLANAAIDGYSPRHHVDGVVINEGWHH